MTQDIWQIFENDDVQSFNDFESKFSKLEEANSFFDKASDFHAKIPILIKGLTNFDPTGVTSTISDLLNSNKADRERKAILIALYSLFCGLQKIDLKIENLDKVKIQPLMEIYFDYCRNSEINKIQFFRNTFISGIALATSSLSEDKNIFDILDKLSLLQISILKILYDKQKDEPYHSLIGNTAFKMNITELRKHFPEVQELILRHLCCDLIGKGLVDDWGIGRMDYNGRNDFIINDFTKFFINRIFSI